MKARTLKKTKQNILDFCVFTNAGGMGEGLLIWNPFATWKILNHYKDIIWKSLKSFYNLEVNFMLGSISKNEDLITAFILDSPPPLFSMVSEEWWLARHLAFWEAEAIRLMHLKLTVLKLKI